MDTFEAINKRRSIRSFKTDTVPMEKVIKIIEGAMAAPSWGNKQCWRFIVVDSNVEKNIIAQASTQANIGKACTEAPYIIVLCANSKDSGVKNGLEYFMFDCGLAMENLNLAAVSEGLATCTVGYFDEKAIKAVLNLPEGMRVIAFTPLGYANEEAGYKAVRKIEEVIFHNTWGKYCEPENK